MNVTRRLPRRILSFTAQAPRTRSLASTDVAHGFSASKPGTATDKSKGFVLYGRKTEPWRDPVERTGDWGEIQEKGGLAKEERNEQAARCMDCGTPFCQTETGCPIHNLIPEFNELVHKEQWIDAIKRLHKTNNFPEFTGRVCPAPCESACVAGLATGNPVTIKQLEYTVVDTAWRMGLVRPRPPHVRTGRRVAVVGSGPAGLAAADELNKRGHTVVVMERDDRPGGLLTYGIPNMKLDKETVERRIGLLEAEGVTFLCGQDVRGNEDASSGSGSAAGAGGGVVRVGDLQQEFDAVVLAVGATKPRDLFVSGRDLEGVHFAMEFLTAAQKRLFMTRDGALESAYGGLSVAAEGKNVVVIGGGDTGTDCIATSLRQRCKHVTNLELVPPPPPERGHDNPWPEYARVFRTDYGHQEAAAVQGTDPRAFSTMTERFVGSGGAVEAVETVGVRWQADGSYDRVPGTEARIPADVVILALGFERPEGSLVDALGLHTDARGNMAAVHGSHGTHMPNVFVAGDCRRGQSLVVWAIHEGRVAAEEAHRFLKSQPEAHRGFASLGPLAGLVAEEAAGKAGATVTEPSTVA